MKDGLEFSDGYTVTAVYWLDEQSTSKPLRGCALADRHRMKVCRWTMMLTSMPSTEQNLRNFNYLCLTSSQSSIYHIAVLMTQKDGISVKKRSMSRTCTFALQRICYLVKIKSIDGGTFLMNERYNF